MKPNLMDITSRPEASILKISPLPISFDMNNESASRGLNETVIAVAHFAAALRESSGLQPTQKPMSCSDAEPNTALLTTIIMLSTFLLTFMFKKLRESFYLGKHVSFLYNKI